MGISLVRKQPIESATVVLYLASNIQRNDGHPLNLNFGGRREAMSNEGLGVHSIGYNNYYTLNPIP